MNYSKFSKEAFKKLGNDTEAIEKLANALQDEALEELHQEILKAFGKVASKLEEQGHSLAPYIQNVIGEYEFRDIDESGNCGLRLACDVIVSSGYNDEIK